MPKWSVSYVGDIESYGCSAQEAIEYSLDDFCEFSYSVCISGVDKDADELEVVETEDGYIVIYNNYDEWTFTYYDSDGEIIETGHTSKINLELYGVDSIGMYIVRYCLSSQGVNVTNIYD